LSSHIILDGLQLFGPGSAASTTPLTKAGVGMLYSHHLILRNLKVGVHGEYPIFSSFVDDLVIEHSEAYGAVNQHGVYLSNSSQRLTVGHNAFHDNRESGLQINPDIGSRSTVPAFPTTGLSHCVLLDGNVLHGNHDAAGFNLQGLRDSVIRNNLLYNTLTSGITLYYGNAVGGSGNVLVAHNTIEIVGGGGGGKQGVHLVDLAGLITLRNNIIYNRLAGAFGALAIQTYADEAFVDSDYNALGSAGATVIRNYRYTEVSTTLAQWQALGKDAHSFGASISALVVKPDDGISHDYHLKPVSAARNAGLAVPYGGVTIEGLTRGSPQVDLGCY
jgi:hypothetical protein